MAHRGAGALAREAPERGALHRRGFRIVGIDLDHPAEAVRLVRLLVQVESLDVAAPGIVAAALAADRVTLERAGLGRLGGVAGEIELDVLLGGEDRIPGADAAGAVVERTEDPGARRIGARAQARAAGGRAGDARPGARGDATVVGTVVHHAPGAAGLRHLEHAEALRLHLDLDALARHLRAGVLAVETWPYQVAAVVFMVHAKQDRKSTRLNSSHLVISYAFFCFKKNNKILR